MSFFLAHLRICGSLVSMPMPVNGDSPTASMRFV
jgi:hypothetical protein